MKDAAFLSKAVIDFSKFDHNIHAFQSLLQPSTKLLAVLKANAYGHGSVPLAQWIQKNKKADYLGVAQLLEALELRENRVTLPILLFGPVPKDQLILALKNNITLPIFTEKQLQDLVTATQKSGHCATIHLKIDSGMGRIGIRSVDDALKIFNKIREYSDLINLEGIFTHFSDAENVDTNGYTKQQFDLFMSCIQAIESTGFKFKLKHCCNTAATILCPDYHLDMVRVGIGLYGYYPDENMKDTLSLKPIMTVESPITHIKQVSVGSEIGYGRTYQANHEISIATVAIGYADGVNRNLSNQKVFCFHGHRLMITGRVCMDQLMLDVTPIKEQISVGDTVTFFGDHTENPALLSLYQLAHLAHSFHYEILCLLGRRVERVYLTNDE